MKQSAPKQYAEIVCSTDQMESIYSPLKRKLPKRVFMLHTLAGDGQQACGVEEEKAVHIAPGEINMTKAVSLFIEKHQGEQGHQEKLPGKP